LATTILLGTDCLAAETETPQIGVAPSEGFTYLGKIRPRHARDMKSSNWAVGAETMGRDYTIYANWRKYLGPLGAKRARIQSGWAKTEQEKGKYDWAWLDEIIPDMIDQGVQPWVCLCYGNPIYPGGGGTGLGGGLPSTPEAKTAWEGFVDAFVERYGDRVVEWEVWNEPKGGVKGVPAYADLVVRTAEVIRKRSREPISWSPRAVASTSHSSTNSSDCSKSRVNSTWSTKWSTIPIRTTPIAATVVWPSSGKLWVPTPMRSPSGRTRTARLRNEVPSALWPSTIGPRSTKPSGPCVA
jgi:hypothetical protein